MRHLKNKTNELYAPLSLKEKIKSWWAAFLQPFCQFNDLFFKANHKERTLIISQLIIPGSGSLIHLQIEKGLFYLISSGLYVYYLISAGFNHLIGKVTNSFLNLRGLFIVLTSMFILLYYLSFRTIIKEVRQINNNQKLNDSYVVSFFKQTIIKFKNYFNNYRHIYKQSNQNRKASLILSYVFMGVDQLIDHQYFKAILFITTQIGYVLYLILVGKTHLYGLFTLKIPQQVSTATLVYGILAIVLTIFFIIVYRLHLLSIIDNGLRRIEGKAIKSYKEEWNDLSNRKFYLLSLIFPILGALLFTIIPLIFMILIAFTDFATSGTIPIMNERWISWTGFDSFRQLFTLSRHLKTFINVLKWTLVWATLATFTCYFGGFFLALLINKKRVKPKVLYRSLFVVAMAVPQFVTLRVMNTMFNEFGPINTLLLNLGIINERIAFWNNVDIAKTLIIFVNMWVGIPYYMLLISGLLLNIPKDHYEAASIEGANKWQQFRKITLPHVFFMTTPLLISSFVGNINNFNVIWLLTGGGPLGMGTGGVAGGSDILITWLYKLTMQNNPEYNLGAAIGIIMFIISAVISLLIFRQSSAYKKEEEFRL